MRQTMKKKIHKCITCERIIGVDINPTSNDKDEVVQELECIDCYNKMDWSEGDTCDSESNRRSMNKNRTFS
jgi:hypothetical protein